MAPGFFPDAVEDDGAQVVERRARAQGGEQVHFLFAQEAQAQASVRGQAGARAGRAERRGDGGDETHVAFGVGQAEEARLAVQLAAVDGLQVAERVFDAFLDFGGGDHLSGLDVGCAGEGHHFDEAHLPGTVNGQAGKIHHVVFVVAAHHHRVEFDGRQPRGLGGQDAVPDILQFAPARQAVKFFRVEGVYRNVDALESRVRQRLCQFGQEQAVRRERDGADALGAGDAAHEFQDVGAHGRLAARQPDLVEAERGEQAREQENLVILHEFRAGAEGLVFRHAVDAAQVAVIGQADAQVMDVASETVYGHGMRIITSLAGRTIQKLRPDPSPALPKIKERILGREKFTPPHCPVGSCTSEWGRPGGFQLTKARRRAIMQSNLFFSLFGGYMSVEFILRIVGMLVSAFLGGYAGQELALQYQRDVLVYVVGLGLVGALAGLVLTPYLTVRPARALRSMLGRVPAETLFAGLTGLVVGLLTAALLAFPLSLLPDPLGNILPFVGVLLFAYFGVSLFVMRQGDIMGLLSAFSGRGGEGGSSSSWTNLNRNILLDTSVIIDGRVGDIAKTGFLPGTLLIPRFVLNELQYVADSPDGLRRARGRRGMETIAELQKLPNVMVRVSDINVEGMREVDEKLVVLARQMKCPILTNDYNLNRVAELQGVTILNINELTNAVKSVVLPGELLKINIIQEGKESYQGVGYMDDGTMVVVENGKDYIGEYKDVTVSKILQTAAGRMIFARVNESNGKKKK